MGLSYSFTLISPAPFLSLLLFRTVGAGKSNNKIPYLTNCCCHQSKIRLHKSLHFLKCGTNACPQRTIINLSICILEEGSESVLFHLCEVCSINN